MTITVDITTPVGEVRSIIGDVSEPFEIATQTIEQYIEKHNGNTTLAAIDCLRLLVASYAKKVNQEVGDVRVWYSERYKQLRTLLNDLTTSPSQMQRVPLPILGGTTNSEMRRVRDSCETPYIGIRVGEFSRVGTVERTGPYTVREG